MAAARERNARGQGARLREELIRAADQLLEAGRGEESLSMRAVAREAGVAPQSVYLHFPDRHALMEAVFDRRFGELIEVLEAALDGLDDARARLLAFGRAYCRYAAEHPGHYRVLFETAGTPGWEPDQMTGLRAFAMLREAMADSGCADAAEAAVGYWAALHGLVALRRDRPSFPWPPIDTLLRVLVDSLTSVRNDG
jgi:AcrR family transcriptional regulator